MEGLVASAKPRAPSSSARFRLGLIGITVAAFAMRLVITLVTRGFDRAAQSDGDGFYYSFVAQALAEGRWFVIPLTGAPTADHPPLTVLALTPGWWLFGSTLAQRVTMVLVGIATVAIIGLIGRRLGGNRVGIVAALIALANPNLWINDSLTMSESLAALFVALLVWSGLTLADEPTLRRSIVTGLTLGVTLLARSELGWFIPLMVLPILLSARAISWPARARLVAVTVACAALVLTPWIGWNATRFAKPVWLSNNAGSAISGANCDATYFGNHIGGWSYECGTAHDRATSDGSENSSRGVSAGLSYVGHHLGRLPVVALAREGRMFGFFQPQSEVDANTAEGRPRVASWAALIAFWLLLVPSAIGMRTIARQGPRGWIWPFVACFGCSVLTAATFYGIPRFRISLDVAMCLLAAVPIASWTNRRQDVMSLRRNHQAPIPTNTMT